LGRAVALPVALAMLLLSVPMGVAQAEFITTDEVIGAAVPDRAQITGFLARTDVQRQLSAFGVDPTEAQARVASLSDAEVSRLAGYIGTLPVGEGLSVVGLVIGAIVLMILGDLMGWVDIL
jgi:hypothetical protein